MHLTFQFSQGSQGYGQNSNPSPSPALYEYSMNPSPALPAVPPVPTKGCPDWLELSSPNSCTPGAWASTVCAKKSASPLTATYDSSLSSCDVEPASWTQPPSYTDERIRQLHVGRVLAALVASSTEFSGPSSHTQTFPGPCESQAQLQCYQHSELCEPKAQNGCVNPESIKQISTKQPCIHW